MNQLGLNRPCPPLWYLLSCVWIDVALEGEVYHRAWVLGGALVLLLMYMTARRFTDIGWSQWWAIPYALLTLCAYSVLFFTPHTNGRIITLGALLLQVPAIVWPKKTGTALPSASEVG